MVTTYTFVPVPASKVETESLGTIDNTCWTPTPRPNWPGPVEESTGPEKDGRFTVEFRRMPARRNVRLCRDERERMAAEYIQTYDSPGGKPVSVREVAKGTKIPRATIGKFGAVRWTLHNGRRWRPPARSTAGS